MTIPDPTHFVDGTPIPPDYLPKLYAFMDGLDEVSEQDELEGLHWNGAVGRYQTKREFETGKRKPDDHNPAP